MHLKPITVEDLRKQREMIALGVRPRHFKINLKANEGGGGRRQLCVNWVLPEINLHFDALNCWNLQFNR